MPEPFTLALVHFQTHPDHRVEVIQTLVRKTDDLKGERPPAIATRWYCASCIANGLSPAEIEAETLKSYRAAVDGEIARGVAVLREGPLPTPKQINDAFGLV